MFYKTGIIGILLLLLSCSPKNSKEKYYSDSYTPTQIFQLVNREPAADTLQTLLISETILRAGTPAVTAVCLMLNTNDPVQRARVEFVLAGLNNYVTHPGVEGQKQKFLQGIYTALQTIPEKNQKALLMSLLRQSGDAGSVSILKPFLRDPDLCHDACRALVAIGSVECGQALLQNLNEGGAPDVDAVIKALGDLDYRPAAEAIFQFASDDHADLRPSVLYALARFGYPAAGPLYEEIGDKNLVLQNNEITKLYLTWLVNINDTAQLSSTCRRIISDKTGQYDELSKIAALKTLTTATAETALPDLLSLVMESSPRTRLAALEISYTMPGETVTNALLKACKTAPTDVRADLIYTLGRRGDDRVLNDITGYLTDRSSAVRAAAVRTIVQLGNQKVAPFLLERLQAQTDESDQLILKTALLELSADSYLPALTASLSGMPVPAKLSGLEIIAKRGGVEQVAVLSNLLRDDTLSIRLAALNTLADIGGPDQLEFLINYLLESNDAAQKSTAAATISVLAGKIKNPEKSIEPILKVYASASTENKTYLLSILKKLGGKSAFQFVIKQIDKAGSAEEKEAAIRTLVSWSGSEALDALTDFATQTKNPTHQILAIRGCVQILGENDLGSLYETTICKRLLNVASRDEEKQMIISALAAIGSEEALETIAGYISDPLLGPAASQAALSIASAEQEGPMLSRAQIADALISSWPDNKVSGASEIPFDTPEGFTALFNGKDLSGWKGLVANPIERSKMTAEALATAQTEANESMADHWRVINGILCFDGKGHSLCTAKDYKNFEFLVDWKIGEKGDSGIYLRGTPQVQIWDPSLNPVGSGGLFNNQNGPSAPLRFADNPVGQWNRFRIIMTGRRVTVYLNEKLVVDDVILENYWERDKMIYSSGQIELQAHSSPLYFKNIFIRELPDEPAPLDGPLFNGKDLSGWEIINQDKSGWQVGEGEILLTEGKGGGWISTTREFADFKLDLEFRLPEGGNSGVFLRTPREGNPAYVGMEIQVLDDYAAEYASLNAWQYTGSIYAVLAPSKRVTKKANEWQEMTIICKGPQVNIILNGEMIIDANLIDFMDKIKDHPGLKRRKGYIGLQSHSTKIEYRHIILKEF